ncbi:diacylglycerol kinase family protein [Rhodoferax sp. U11-2br]|uniref:diacylglycerol/lipid kinase family protein n=1 Tax=Rhodoferax sp. U11-2br TaxID=2838878 RepID=UPI001BE7E8D3|nr:diacylglycerol kinase family protein [Rhodoferax sp. U11-2br]MBT3067503.1 diacylglycerol kinase [Rhodoferax sp. U11-2br]
MPIPECPLLPVPDIDDAAHLLFVINAASGRHDADVTRQVIETTLQAAGRTGELLFARPDELARVAQRAARTAAERRTAVIAVGGDGTINSVAQAAHAQGCPMGVMPQGTFNYFARTHAIPTDPAAAAQALLGCEPVAIQVGLINDRVFLVNASVGLYPQLLEDREAYKARFGRSRLVAFGAGLVTLLGRHHQLRLRIELGPNAREITTPTLFVGNNRLQLEQVGLSQASSLDEGCIAAVMLRPIGTVAMLGLIWRGAMGTLGEADTVESFKFQRMRVKPRRAWGSRTVKVAFDGEVSRMPMPLQFQVSPKPLYLLKSAAEPAVSDAEQGHA